VSLWVHTWQDIPANAAVGRTSENRDGNFRVGGDLTLSRTPCQITQIPELITNELIPMNSGNSGPVGGPDGVVPEGASAARTAFARLVSA